MVVVKGATRARKRNRVAAALFGVCAAFTFGITTHYRVSLRPDGIISRRGRALVFSVPRPWSLTASLAFAPCWLIKLKPADGLQLHPVNSRQRPRLCFRACTQSTVSHRARDLASAFYGFLTTINTPILFDRPNTRVVSPLCRSSAVQATKKRD